MSSSISSARFGFCRMRDSTALMLLNRKCGRMRACSACSRASESAGDSALLRSWKYLSSAAVTSSTSSTVAQRAAPAPRRAADAQPCRAAAVSASSIAITAMTPSQPGRRRSKSFATTSVSRLRISSGWTRAEISSSSCHSRVRLGGLENRRGERDDVHDDQDAQQHAEIAEIRQGAGVGVLIYTSCHVVYAARASLPRLDRPVRSSCPSSRSRRQILAGRMTANDNSRNQPWSGRFGEPVSDLVQRFTASVAFDQRLAEFDIEASGAHARMLQADGHHLQGRPGGDREGPRAGPRRDPRRHLCLVARARGRAFQHRAAPDRARRRAGQAAAHRALAQRPGRDRRAALPAHRDRSRAGAHQGPAAAAARPRRRARRDRDAGLHAHAAGAAGVASAIT